MDKLKTTIVLKQKIKKMVPGQIIILTQIKNSEPQFRTIQIGTSKPDLKRFRYRAIFDVLKMVIYNLKPNQVLKVERTGANLVLDNGVNAICIGCAWKSKLGL